MSLIVILPVYNHIVLNHLTQILGNHIIQCAMIIFTQKYDMHYTVHNYILTFTHVTIGQCCLFVWVTVVGIGISYVTVGGSRSPSNLVSLQPTPAGMVASPAVTGKRIQSRADLLEYSETVICLILVILRYV